MNVVELPAVENLELEYVYPSYTGLPPQKVERAETWRRFAAPKSTSG